MAKDCTENCPWIQEASSELRRVSNLGANVALLTVDKNNDELMSRCALSYDCPRPKEEDPITVNHGKLSQFLLGNPALETITTYSCPLQNGKSN